MNRTQSSDGTVIAFDHSGTGPPLILVVGAFSDRSSTKTLASRLGSHYAVVRTHLIGSEKLVDPRSHNTNPAHLFEGRGFVWK